ncbi:hypothetical protein SAE02_57610 [Skermanella aerolata]|uniref:DNA methylase adenine-specific domain-containing protein n=1 Tax=Skermanella aerolata TaxID=393310 RepID=A0A512DYP0_9PROT|nr:N-6 DNA methylase [Skermanella aerolata]KJB93051.1 hypothetical protein N826_18575 [Skermanella aerolata KACC 11604]GEO41613.1 hypothetical protein SAE02_57610 [Skermanella aerolata]
MAHEELVQNRYLEQGKLVGSRFGAFERLSLGNTTLKALATLGVTITPPTEIKFPLVRYKPPKNPANLRPDQLFLQRDGDNLMPVAVGENKDHGAFLTERDQLYAAEQALCNAIACATPVAFYTDGTTYHYIDVNASITAQRIIPFPEKRDLNPAVLHNLLRGDTDTVRDPGLLAEKVWQLIWHTTKAEPRQCLLTFVEIFMLKFLSDNLSTAALPRAHQFYELLEDPSAFKQRYGVLPIEYYIREIRPRIKTLFPDNVVCNADDVGHLFGLQTVVSKTSVINGFAFLRSSSDGIATFSRTFVEILHAFNDFGPLTRIDPQFKLRLYETFLKRSARQQRLGQFFTPRNVVRPVIRMAELGALPDNSVVLDPAAGVGGFILEPLLFEDDLKGNITFRNGHPCFRVRMIGIDVEADLHILAKANMMLHLAECIRDPTTTLAGLNAAMAETILLMNENETLGSLLNPPRDSVDVILTNPPYVTDGSGVYAKELAHLKGVMKNGVDLRKYYGGSGLGVESLFLRYITGALKPGGRAFVIVPLGLLNRTEAGPRIKVLQKCNILASIQLPQGTFFNTTQKTYLLVLERRHTDADERPPVLCGIARTIGETLDRYRAPTPEDNDLDQIAGIFVALHGRGHRGQYNEHSVDRAETLITKVRDAADFSAADRWDVARFWSDQELVALGEKQSAVDRIDWLNDVTDDLEGLLKELSRAKRELTALSADGPTKDIRLDDEQYFHVRSGDRIKTEEIRANPGSIVVYSCFRDAAMSKGSISVEWLLENDIPVEHERFVSINANGASVGKVFVREAGCVITDDVIAVHQTPRGRKSIDLDFLAIELRRAVEQGGFLYEAKLFLARAKDLTVRVPITPSGAFDRQRQQKIAKAVKRFDLLRSRVHDLGQRAQDARVI